MDDIHDKVVRDIVSQLNTETYAVYINPGQEKNAGIGDNYPDVILTKKNESIVRFIMEVETVDSISTDEAIKQWKKYTEKISATFYLVVPLTSLKKAKELCQREGINARFVTYSVSENVITYDFQ